MAPTQRPASQRAEPAEPAETGGTTLHIPVPTLGMRTADVHLPQLAGADAAEKVRSAVPSPLSLAYFVGLGVMGVLDILAWPVVLAIGAGVALTEWMSGQQAARGQQPADTKGNDTKGNE